jgi:hypothetical protein
MHHSSIFLRREEIIKHKLFYDGSYAAEDYELWLRAIKTVRFANIGEVLVHYRVTEDNRTMKVNAIIAEQEQQLYKRSLAELGIEYACDRTLSIWVTFSACFAYDAGVWRARLLRLRALLLKIVDQNKIHGIYDAEALRVCADRYWFNQLDAPDRCLGADRKLPLELISDLILNEVNALLPDSAEICLFGLGRIGRAALSHFIEYFGKRTVCVSDNDAAKWGTSFNGVPCVNPQDIPAAAAIIVTTGYDAMRAIVPQLQSTGHDTVIPYTRLVR